MEPIKAFIQKWRDKLAYMEFGDLFPQNRKCDIRDVKSVLFFIGIYLGALIICALMFVILGATPWVGWLFRAVGSLVAIYAIVGMLHILAQYMKFNS
ncbi:hypothetical protein [Ruminococcus sp.]|uniref:hypothetical protein n=1 Tax=Ruminococcus sp. TaxID=41978 RepID=UPI0025F1A2BA|nr:hypothetical protein [Ruminococcus sp.]MBQ8967201.1 hypothetical protein [Ruminococcus sp.]